MQVGAPYTTRPTSSLMFPHRTYVFSGYETAAQPITITVSYSPPVNHVRGFRKLIRVTGIHTGWEHVPA